MEVTPKRETVKKSKKGGWLILLFAVVFVAVVLLLTDVLRKKWYDVHNAQPIVQGYYQEKDHSIDVLCLGSSSVRNGISGLEMYRDYGFTTYSRATSTQLPVISYYLLQETLETQDIKAVVLDVNTITDSMLNGYSDQDIVGKIHEAVDYMPMSSYKIKLIREILNMDLPVTLADFILPLYTYHARWEELTKDDFIYRTKQKDYCYKGQNPNIKTYAHTFDSKFMSPDDDQAEAVGIDESLLPYYLKTIELCKEKGIALVMVKMPSRRWSLEGNRIMQALADEQGVAYLDFNLNMIRDQIDFNPKQDFCDSIGHINVTGARKISRYLGEYLTSLCALEDRRNDPAYASWNEDLDKYENLLADAELARETNLISYLQRLNNPDYITMIATRDTVSRYYNENVAAAFRELGVDQPFGKHTYFSYIAVLDGGKPVFERASHKNKSAIVHTMELDGHAIIVSSFSARAFNDATITFDNESVGPNLRGFNFVVYDRKVNQIVSQKSFNTGLNGTNYSLPDPFSGAADHPVRYLDMLDDSDYITVIGVSGDAMKCMPAAVNKKLADMGLLPLDGEEFRRPYLAILNGSEVVYNEYGAANSEISISREVDGTAVTAVSSTVTDKNNFYAKIGGAEFKTKAKGLLIHVYSKSKKTTVSTIRFNWTSKNYVTEQNFNKIDNLRELIEAAKADRCELYFAYSPKLSPDGLSGDVPDIMEENGFEQFFGDRMFAGVLNAEGTVKQEDSASKAVLEFERDGIPIAVTANSQIEKIKVNGVRYYSTKPGLYVVVYSPEHQTVLAEKIFGSSGS